MRPKPGGYVSRAGVKLAAALDHFQLDVSRWVCADLGSHVGGFTDCLLQHHAARVYAVDTCYGTLAWKLRRDPRVVVMERTNAMHVTLPEPVDLVTIDLGWTRQARILPNVAGMILPNAHVISLLKPHYEAPADLLLGGLLPDQVVGQVVADVLNGISSLGWTILDTIPSPIRGHGGNREFLALLRRTEEDHPEKGVRMIFPEIDRGHIDVPLHSLANTGEKRRKIILTPFSVPTAS